MDDATTPQPPAWARSLPPAGWTPVDAIVAVLFLALVVSEIVPNPDMTPHGPLLALAPVLTLPLAWRASHPAVVALVIGAAHLATSAVATGEYSPQLAILPVLVALYAAAHGTRGVRSVAIGAATLTLTVAAWVVSEDGHADDFWPWMLWAGAWAAGTFVRRRTEVAAHHAGRAAALEVEAQTTAAASAQAERDRIARELHDVVAHSVSVMVVQAGAERLRLGPDAGRTGAALEAIEQAGRDALAELRSMLGVMRDVPGQELEPLPGLDAIPGLVERVRRAGLPVDLDGPDHLARPELAPGVGLAAYRIVQEALTNVVRHAGPVPTRVVVRREQDHLTVRVENGAGRPVDDQGGGRGLLGMRERAAAVGGRLTVGPQPGGGFAVEAVLPVTAGEPAR